MKDYNGFSASFRQKQYNKKKELIAQGKMENWADKPCEICGLKPKKGVLIMGHCEDYNDLYDNHSICVECHMKLHRRFSDPILWINHLIAVKKGYVSKGYNSVFLYFQDVKNGKVQKHDFTSDIAFSTKSLGDQWFHKLF